MPRTRRSLPALSGAALVAGLVICLPLARGGVAWWAALAATLAASAAVLLTWRTEKAFPLAGFALGVVWCVVAFQAVPWPAALHRLEPETRALFELVLTPIGLYPAARPFSLDPPATGRELALGAAGLGAFLVAWSSGAGHRRRGLLLGALGLAGTLVAAAVLGGALLGQPLLAPRFPFLNPNHLAGLLGLTTFVMLGLALRAHGQARLLWLVAFATGAAALFASLSRGGIGAFLGGTAVFALLGARREAGSTERRRSTRLVAVAGVAAGLAAAAYLALAPVLERLATLQRLSDDTKVSLWRPAAAMVRDHPLLGIGRGAFETVFPSYKTDPDQLTFTHLENEWLQPLVELGIPAGLLLVGGLAAAWTLAARRRDHGWTDVGLLAGTATVAAQNMVDFSLELPGVAVPFMVAMGLLARGAGGRSAPRLAVGLAAMLLGAGGTTGILAWRAHPTEGITMATAIAEDADGSVRAAREAMELRPADYLAPAWAGIRLVEAGRCAEGVAWLNRAMLLNPTAPEAHLHVARCLAAANQGTLARREYRLAWTYGRADALAEAAERYPEVEELVEVAPATPAGLLALGALLGASRPADAAVVYRKAYAELGEPRALLPLARATRAAGDPKEALALARRREVEAPSDAAGWRLAAELLVELEDEEAAAEEIHKGLAHAHGAVLLQGFLVDRALLAHRVAEAKKLADEIEARTPAELAQKQRLVARALAAQGRYGEAIERARSAASLEPESPWVLMDVIWLCEQAERWDDAIAALEHLAPMPGQRPEEVAARIEKLRAKKEEQRLRRLDSHRAPATSATSP